MYFTVLSLCNTDGKDGGIYILKSGQAAYLIIYDM